MFPVRVTAATALILFGLSGCATDTYLSSAQEGGALQVKTSKTSVAPRSDTFKTTTFGNYEFKATAPGMEPFTGILPLKFNGGYLALDILFFAPATFFNLREPYSYYEFDVAKRQVRYKKREHDEWAVYVPKEAEVTRGLRFFESRPSDGQ